MSKPVGIWVLIVAFGWSVLNQALALVDTSGGYSLLFLEAVGLPLLHWPVSIVLLALDVAGLAFVLWPRPIGLPLVLAAQTATIAWTLVTGVLSVMNVDTLRAAAEAATTEKTAFFLGSLTSPTFAIPLFVTSLAISLVLALLALRNRRYFTGEATRAC